MRTAPRGGDGPSTIDRLQTEPQRFTFDAAVRILTILRGDADPATAVRFASVSGSAFLGTEVSAVDCNFQEQSGSDLHDSPEPGDGRKPPQLRTGLVALTGPVGVLPHQYSEAVLAGPRSRPNALADFLDLLAQRMVAAFARAGRKYRPQLAADIDLLTNGVREADRFSEVLLAVTGYGTPHLADRLPAGAPALRHYSGFFSAHPRSADRLEALASDWLGRPVRIDQLIGAWLAIPPDQRTRLPVGKAPGNYCQLSVDAAAGVRAWDQQARIVLRIGPLGLRYFESLLPNRPLLRELASLVRAFVGFEIGFSINPILAREAVPALTLAPPASDNASGAGPLLGWNTWLPTSQAMPRRVDAADAVFEDELIEGLP